MHYKKECCYVHLVPGMADLGVVSLVVSLVVVFDDFRVGQAFCINCLFTLIHLHFFKH